MFSCQLDFLYNSLNRETITMIRVKITANTLDPFIRQTTGRRGIWNDMEFVFDERDEGPFDAWVVLENMAGVSQARCPKSNTVFVTYEPPSIRGYDDAFLRQFGTVLSFRTDLRHRNRVRTHPLLPWWIGTCGGHAGKQVTKDYDALKNVDLSQKQKAISCVCSDKAATPDHRKRLNFIRSLKDRLGERLQIFGPGFRDWPAEWPDKWDSIAPYQYHLAIENSSHPDYWTEKVADTFLGGAFLIYWGCPNLGDYFPTESFLTVDRDDPDATAEAMNNLLDSARYDKSGPAIAEARRLVLDDYNLFAELAAYAKTLNKGRYSKISLRPEESFKNTFVKRARRFLERNLVGNAERR
jgi:hypothetical protein